MDSQKFDVQLFRRRCSTSTGNRFKILENWVVNRIRRINNADDTLVIISAQLELQTVITRFLSNNKYGIQLNDSPDIRQIAEFETVDKFIYPGILPQTMEQTKTK